MRRGSEFVQGGCDPEWVSEEVLSRIERILAECLHTRGVYLARETALYIRS